MKKLFILFCAAAFATAFPAVAQTFSTGTYNVRQLNAGDDAKGNGWQRRLPVIASLVRFHDFDIFGAQEDPSRPNKGWDAKYVRICCWGRFLDRETRERF